MFAIDHPYQDTSSAVEFMKRAPIPDADKEKSITAMLSIYSSWR